MDTKLGKGLFAVMLVVMMVSVSSIFVGTNLASALTEGSYTYTVTGSEATITGYTGTDAALSIPSTLGGFPVTAIADNAFIAENTLTSVTIPASITHIGASPFYGCSLLLSISVDVSNPSFASSGGVLYNHDLSTLVKYPEAKAGNSFTIPETVTTLTDNAFFSCDNLISIAIPSSLSSVGTIQFLLCSALTDFATDINSPFYSSTGGVLYDKFQTTLVSYAYGLTAASFTIPGTVNGIAPYAFYNSRATSVTIPEGVMSIGDYAFKSCALTSVTIPDSVTSMGNFTFYNSVYINAVNIGSGVTYVGSYSFQSCSGLSSVSLGANVLSIGENAFALNNQLTAINLPSNLTTIGIGAFWMNGFSSITIPETVTSIGDYSFQTCTNLASIRIPDGVTALGNRTFSGCDHLVSVVIGNSTTYLGSQTFKNCYGLTSVTIGKNVTSIGSEAFLGCTLLTSITFQGLVAPPSVGSNWITGTNAGILGHAYEASNFPAAGQYFRGLLMGGPIPDLPGAPTGLTAVAGFEQVALNWTAPASTSGYGIDYYLVNQDGAGTGDHIIGTTTTITGLTNGQAYSFTVQAHTAIGTGSESIQALSSPFDMPGAPTGLNAVPGSENITVSWTAPADNGGAVIGYYIVYQWLGGSWSEVGNVTGTTAVISGLTSGQNCEFAVAAHNAAGLGVKSVSVSAIPDIYISVDVIPSAQYVNGTTAGNAIVDVSAASSLPSITLSTANVSHFVDGVLIGNAVITVGGTSYSAELPLTLYVGINVLTYTFNDSVGNSVFESITVVYDNSGPTVSIVSPLAGSYNNTGSVTIEWASSDVLSGIAYHELRLDSGPILTLPSDDHSFQLNDLVDGNHTVTMVAYDAAGNINQTSVSFIVHTVPPVITCNPSSPIYTNENWIEVHVSMSDAVPMTTGNVSLYSNGILMESYPIYGMDGQTSSGYFAMLYPEHGVNQYRVTVNDSAGNSNSIVVTIYRDATPPTVSIVSPSNHAYNNTGSMILAWRGTDSIGIDRYEIFVNGGKVATLGASTTSNVLSLPEGHDEIEIYVYDLAGNSAHASINVIVDLTGPIVAIASPVEGERTGSSVNVSWQGADPLSGIARYLVSIDGGQGIELSAATHSHGFTGLAPGPHTVLVKVFDNTGNSADDSVTFTVDAVTPTVTSATPAGDNVSRNATIVIVFSEAMNQTSTVITIAGVDGTLTWSGNTATFTPSSALAYDTSYTVTVIGHDLAGNSMTATESFTTLKGYSNISGVIKEASGNVLAGATVSLSNGMTTTTDANGAFSFSNVLAGSYNLTIGKTGYETVTRNVSTIAGETTALGSLSVTTAGATPNNDIGIMVIVAVVAIIALLFVLIVFMRRRKKKE